MMRKLSFILMAFALFGLVSLSSCSGSANKPADENTEQEVSPAQDEVSPADTAAYDQNEMNQDSTDTDME
jgi:ABC-type oligopeptide transport system substrate-binding subunit